MKKIYFFLLSFLFITLSNLFAAEREDQIITTFMMVQSLMKGMNWAFNPPVSQEEFENNLTVKEFLEKEL